MDVGRRAKQFAPFAALRGLDETIRQRRMIKNRITGDPILADPYGRDYQMADGIIIRLRRNSRI